MAILAYNVASAIEVITATSTEWLLTAKHVGTSCQQAGKPLHGCSHLACALLSLHHAELPFSQPLTSFVPACESSGPSDEPSCPCSVMSMHKVEADTMSGLGSPGPSTRLNFLTKITQMNVASKCDTASHHPSSHWSSGTCRSFAGQIGPSLARTICSRRPIGLSLERQKPDLIPKRSVISSSEIILARCRRPSQVQRCTTQMPFILLTFAPWVLLLIAFVLRVCLRSICSFV